MIDLRKLAGLPEDPGGYLQLGVVVDNLDEQKRGRVKVYLPQVHQSPDVTGLPWAMPISPGFGGGTGTEDSPSTDNWGWIAVPQVGDTVALLALYGDMSTLYYIGGIKSVSESLPETPDTAGSTDPSTYQLRFHNGHRIVARTGSDSEILLETEKGYTVAIDDANDRIKCTVGSASITLNSDGSILINGTSITATASGVVDINGSSITLN